MLLRLALLILHTPPYKPVEVILSYSHLSLQNATILEFAPAFRERARIGQLLSASPFNMGLLTPSPPTWHPAPEGLRTAASQTQKDWPAGLPDLALGYAIRHCGPEHGNFPLVAGLSNPEEVHQCVRVWREIQKADGDGDRRRVEEKVRETFRQAGFLDWSWASP